jgi:hypothetical protein
MACRAHHLFIRQFLGPDSKEVIKANVPEYCDSCDFWWKKNNTYRRQQPQQ